jgi:hypothetical protein
MSMLPGFALAAAPVANVLSNRIQSQIAEGIPMGATSTLMASMYPGMPYGQIEQSRLSNLGRFAGTRQDAAAAQQMGFRYGQTPSQNNQFLQGVGNMTQAYGGTITSSQAAQMTGSFLDPMVLRRQISSGMTPARLHGQVRNSMEVAQDYVKNFETRFNQGRKLNEFDFINLGTPGNGLRIRFQRLYQLDDTALDMIVVAGMQTLQAGGRLDYNSTAALSNAGMSRDRISLAAASLTTQQSTRSANFLANNEGGMVTQLHIEESLQKELGKLEDHTSGLISEFSSSLQIGRIRIRLRGLRGSHGRANRRRT